MNAKTDLAKLAEQLFDGAEYVRPLTIAHTLDVAPATVYRWIAKGFLPSVRVGGSIRVRSLDVAAMMKK